MSLYLLCHLLKIVPILTCVLMQLSPSIHLVEPPTNLSVSDTDEPLVHQLVPEWVPRLTLHDVALGRFIS